MNICGNLIFLYSDFAGQEVYRYTHQLFLSDNSLCLILYNVTTAPNDATAQLLYWVESVAHRAPNAVCLLIGTHACEMDTEIAQTFLARQMTILKSKFPHQLRDSFLIDSHNEFGLSSLTAGLVRWSREKVFLTYS
jgi:internalin A